MSRPSSPGAESLLGQEVQVLDLGFVQAVDYMGNDEEVVQAARVSYGPSTRKLHDDRGLLRYLMRHKHTSPFEMCEVKFRCKMPIFVARQWVRHRTANVNEMSLRYSEAPDEFYVPDLEQVTLQSKDNKQGRDTEPLSPEIQQQVQQLLRAHDETSYALYQEIAVKLGIARELSRTLLPVSLYTQWIWKIDLHNLFHFLSLRLDAHAQWETRQFAEAMAAFTRAWVPQSWEAFEDYRLHAVYLSRHEFALIQRVLEGHKLVDEDLHALSKREREAFFLRFPGLRIMG